MKNIILLPTDKPSRLRYSLSNQLVLIKESYSSNYGNEVNQHIYITNDEEIKVGDYFIESLGLPDSYLVHKLSKEWKDKESFYRRCTKVILTTDADLIEDRVESIDDEFLEWFVKNPNCEEVEIHHLRIKDQETGEIFHYRYEIDTPKKEPKQKKWDKLNKEFDSALDSEFGSEEPKQETLDEVAEKYAEGKSSNPTFRNTHIRDFKAGADWQSERMYSEEEVIKIVEKSRETGLTAEFLLLTEQFKKK
jgi:hypothetical protein